jgi:hypothetical protein
MKRSEVYFSAIQLPVDFLMIVLAALSAYAVRDVPQILALRPKLYDVDITDFLLVILAIAPVSMPLRDSTPCARRARRFPKPSKSSAPHHSFWFSLS